MDKIETKGGIKSDIITEGIKSINTVTLTNILTYRPADSQVTGVVKKWGLHEGNNGTWNGKGSQKTVGEHRHLADTLGTPEMEGGGSRGTSSRMN